jgi:diguanylate cyclase (GGDEF)-like protein/PAS domain S-box-containing protein
MVSGALDGHHGSMGANRDIPTDLFTDWYWEQDAELRFTRFEGRMAEMSGQRPTEAIGLRRWELPGIAPVSSTWEEHRAALEARRPFRDFEYSRLQQDGALHFVSVSGDPLFDAQGRFTGYRGVSSDITKRKRAEEALRLAEHNYRSIFDNAVEGMYRIDRDGRVSMANLALARMLGFDTTEALLTGIRSVAQQVYVDPADRARYRALLEEKGIVSGFETRWRRADGTVIWVSISGRRLEGPDGEPFYLGSAMDITERKREVRLLALEHRVARLLAEARPADEAILAVMEAVARSEGWECARYFTVDEKAERIRLRHTWHDGTPSMQAFTEGSREIAFRKGEGLAGSVWEAGELLWVPDVTLDARVAMRALASRAGVHGAIVVPVHMEGRVVGALSISSASIREPDARLSRALEMICSQVGQFLQRKQAERIVAENEARFRSLTELSSDFYWETDAEHRVARLTHGGRYRTILGGALTGQRRWELQSTLPPAGWASHRADMEAHRPFRDFEFGRLDPEGLERHLSISGEPVFGADGAFTGYRGIGKDITARKREERILGLEHAVARSLHEADSVSEALRTVMGAICRSEDWGSARWFKLDEAQDVMRLSEAWTVDEEMARYAEASRSLVVRRGEGLVGHAWQSGEPIWVADVLEDARLKMRELARAAGLRGAFVLPLSVGGRIAGVLSFMSSRVREPDQRLLQCLSVIGSQLGQFLQRKQAEEEQRASRQLLDNIVENIPSAVQLKSVRDGYRMVLWNKAAEAMYGLPREEATGRAVHDLWPKAAADAMHAADEELVRSGGMHDFPDRLAITRHRGAIHVHMRKVALLDAAGAVSHILVVADDVSARLQAEERRTRHLRYQELLARFGEDARRIVREAFGNAAVEIKRAEDGTVEILAAATAQGAEESSFLEAAASVLSAGLRRIESEARLAFLAQFDGLTGLPNRALLRDRFSQMIVQAQRHGSLLGVLFIDLDHFKHVNDTLGHSGGDALLREVARRLQAVVRPGDTVARISGDEFAVLLGDLARAEDAALVAQKIPTRWRRRCRSAARRRSSRRASASPPSPPTAPTPRRCCAPRTRRCTAPSRRGAAPTSTSPPRSRSARAPGPSSAPTCAARSTAANSTSPTSPSSTCAPACPAGGRRCCAGAAPTARWSRPTSSCRCWKRPASSSRSASGCCAASARTCAPGRRRAARWCRSPSTCRRASSASRASSATSSASSPRPACRRR